MRSLLIIHSLSSIAFKREHTRARRMPLAELTQLVILRFLRLADPSWPNDSGRTGVQA
jgi:hypothetical protein